ncbi:hypothetical protein B0H13DRAFT_2385471 [Mycena leptocephala]|nr:hypothetical protein B0H13DRAFT_2385471 [Mycena leptocephala]
MPARCFPHAHARSHFHCVLAVSRTTAHCFLRARSPHCVLAVSRTPTRISACLLMPTRISAACSLFPARPLIVSCAPVCRTFPTCLFAASRFLLRLVLPLRLASLGTKHDKNRL